MTEQTYMKLQDKINRPKFDVNKINVEHPRFKSLVDEYVRWNQDTDYTSCDRTEYENDIRGCLDEFDLDGYHLAEHLKNKVWVEPDADLVDILDDATFVKSALEKEMLTQWVKENFLTIPDDVVGKKVNAKQGLRKYENYYITGIRAETYQVTVSDNSKKIGGWIVGFEDVTFID
jgi:hypothetical protein